MTKSVYLKPNVVAEPLFNQWYVWSYLLSPSTAPMYLANLHLSIMESFVSAPEVHVAAHANPKMVGAPFINYDAGKVPMVRRLLERTRREQAHLVKFAEAVKELDQLLSSKPKGFSLEPCYREVPSVLRGYVELICDMNHNPAFRFLEGLLYKSPYYDKSLQSISLSLIHGDYRPFVFSTPRLEDDGAFQIRLPFDSERLDELFRMKRTPRPLGYIEDILGVHNGDASFGSFFTSEPPKPAQRYTGDGVRVRYYSHACLLIETRDVAILTDPVVSYRYPTDIQRYSYDDLPDVIDYVLISHNHQDHCMYETLLQLRHKIRTIIVPPSGGGIADPSLKLLLKHAGLRDVVELAEMDSLDVPSGSILAVPFLGEHADLDIRTKTGYLLQLAERSVYVAADSCNIEPRMYQALREAVGPIDVVFLGMECDGAPLTWLYGPLLFHPISRRMDRSRCFNGSNFEQAAALVEELAPKQVFIYAMGLEPWLVYLTSLAYAKDALPMLESDRLVAYCHARGIPAERLAYQRELVL